MTTHDHKFEINYIFRNDPMAEVIDAQDETLPTHLAAHHLLQLHQNDIGAEHLPAADATADEIMGAAEAAQITDIRVTKIHAHDKGSTPGHYQQP